MVSLIRGRKIYIATVGTVELGKVRTETIRGSKTIED